MSWELIGEDCEAMYHPEVMPLDWRTKAKALLDYGGQVDRWAALQSLKTARLIIGAECWAPPGEWYGGTWINASGDQPDSEIEGWVQVAEDHHCECVDPEGEDDDGECLKADILCLKLDQYDEGKVREACLNAPPEIHLVTAGEGWPWLSRIISPVTILVL